MSGAMIGMNPDEVENLSKELGYAADGIGEILRKVDAIVRNTTWVGDDATQFKGEEWTAAVTKLNDVQGVLEGASGKALHNATQQRSASQGGTAV